ncbi:MAG: hypothetical protein K2J70_00065 [Muribaculaceae bacterium]|nr:hypothetical protein [Muribaculaceae bacterium]
MKIQKITEEIRVFLKTQDEDMRLRRFLHNQGWKWLNGTNIMDFPMRTGGKTLVILPEKRVVRSASDDYAINLDEFEKEYVDVI